MNRYRTYALATAVLLLPYLVWLFFSVRGVLGVIFLLVEVSLGTLPFLFIANHWTLRKKGVSETPAQGKVAVFLPIVDEPLFIFEPVLRSALAINYPLKTVYVLDDKGREDVALLCELHGAVYLSRPHKGEHAKAGNLNFGLAQSSEDFVLVLDADQRITNENILADLLGYFADDSKLAFVTTRQTFRVPEGDFNHDHLFYDYIQNGKNANNAAISTGSGVLYRRNALETVGGFPTWSLVEDLYVSIKLQYAGFNSLYVDTPYTEGLAPTDLKGIYKQRGTWALDTLRIFFHDSPLLARGLTLRQRLHYAEIGITYCISAICIPILFALPAVSLLFNFAVVDNFPMYLALRIPSLIALLLFYEYVCKGFTAGQYWAGLWPVYLKALVQSFSGKKPRYQVTSKTAVPVQDIWRIMPQSSLCALLFVAGVIHYVQYGLTDFLFFNAISASLATYWFFPIIAKGLRPSRVSMPKKIPSGSALSPLTCMPAEPSA